MLIRPPSLIVAVVLAATGGLLIRTAFPAPAVWPLAFLGLVLVLIALRGRGFFSGILVGLVAGATLWGSLIFWLTLYLGPIPWLALCGLMTLWVGLSGGLIAMVYRWVEGLGSWMWFGATPMVVAALWSARESLAASWPYGGFSWARLAYTQAESPFGDTVSWVGVPALSFIVAFASAGVVAILVRPHRRAMIAFTSFIVVWAVIPVFPNSSSGTMTVLAAQGNSDAGLFSQYTPGEILSDHVSVTRDALADNGGKAIDVIVWPENAADIDPIRSTVSAATLDAVSREAGAPIVTGTITRTSADEFFNSSLVWQSGSGVVAQYDKMRPVPFAEYMPDREFFHALVPDLVDLVSRDYAFGTRPNVVTVNGVRVGISICFDITDSSLTSKMIRDGAQVIFAQTNNADFGTTDENLQQLEIARIAAMESGRSVVNVSTVGTTAIIRPDGSTQARIPPYKPGYILDDVALSTVTTPAMVFSKVFELLIVVLAAAGLVAFAVASIRQGPRDLDRDAREDTSIAQGE